jgi:hypothetical protein
MLVGFVLLGCDRSQPPPPQKNVQPSENTAPPVSSGTLVTMHVEDMT